jgi:hypothetical protein
MRIRFRSVWKQRLDGPEWAVMRCAGVRKRSTAVSRGIGKPVGNRPIAAVRGRPCASVEQGQVARGTFSGPRSRGTVFSSQALRHQQRLFVRRARPPRMVPAPVPQATCPGHPGRMRRRGMHPRMNQGGGGAPGRRPRSSPKVAGHSGADAAADCGLRRLPASAGRRAGAGQLS